MLIGKKLLISKAYFLLTTRTNYNNDNIINDDFNNVF